MPTYQYACTSCGERLEVVQKFSDDPLTVCPACEGALRKVFSPVGVVFKGSGFYKTDSRSKPAASSSPSGGGGSDDTTKSDPPAKSDGGGSAVKDTGTATPSKGDGGGSSTASTDRVA